MESKLFVTCQETLEPLLVDELQELGFTEIEQAFCGVFVPASIEAIYKINYLSRIGGRVLDPIASFPCRSKEELYAFVKELEIEKYLSLKKTFAIDVNGQNKAFNNTFYAAQVTKDAICDRFREKTEERPSVSAKSPDVQLNLFLQHNRVTLSFDTSGEPLFKREYRRETVAAPMQESLAAAILRIAKYKGDEELIDPCCGSGTILIEAALIASRTPPGYFRKKWGFFSHPDFSKETWDSFKADEDSKRIAINKDKIIGFDINRECVRVANVNIRSAGLQDAIVLHRLDFREEWPPIGPPNLLITNPPHGGRLGDEEQLIGLYRSLGDCFKQKLAKPSKAFVFTASPLLSKEVGLKPKQRHILKSSGTECRLLEFDIY